MRLTAEQTATIVSLVHRQLGPDVRIRVYGSRLNDRVKGGDLDLLVESPHRITRLQRAELKMLLETALQIPVDILAYQHGTEPNAFQAIALAQAIPLERAA
jgi:predicted nucleotidyltransferase